jgi:hypothetical protein
VSDIRNFASLMSAANLTTATRSAPPMSAFMNFSYKL